MGDLGCSDSSGFVGSSRMSSTSTKFQLNLPCSNFPVSVSSDSYRTGLGSITSSHHPEEDDFSEDSLLECESPGKRNRVTQRLAELAQQIDCDDSLANIDSLKSRNDDNINPHSSLVLIDSLNPAMTMSTTTLVSEADSLEFSPATSNRHDLQKKINVINAQIKDIETRQLLNELESLEKEILSVSLRQQQESSSASRSCWTVTDIEIACDDLTDNNVMTYSYENVGSMLGSSRRDSLISTATVSVCDIDISGDPPVPQKATLPSPVPNFTKFNSKKALKPTIRPMVSHTGAVGVTSMWIPASNSSDCLSSPSGLTGPPAVRPKIQSKCSTANSNITNKSLQRTNIRDNGAIGKKLQIQSILPNKHKAEGSKSCLIIMECCKKLPPMFIPI